MPFTIGDLSAALTQLKYVIIYCDWYYLGDDAFIHSGITEVPTVLISNMKNKQYHFLTARRINPLMIETYRMNFR